MTEQTGTLFRTAQEHAYHYLRVRILSGELASGQRINLDLIAKALGVSRMPVRDALRQLSAEGLVTIYPRRGVSVTSLAAVDVLDLFEMRSELEGLAVRRALPSIQQGDIEQLEKMADDMEAVEKQPMVWLPRHDAFHDYLCTKAGSPRLVAQIRNFRQSVEPYIRLFLTLYDAEMPGAEHRGLIDAIKLGDAPAAEGAMREHITSAAAAILKFLRKVGDGDGTRGARPGLG